MIVSGSILNDKKSEFVNKYDNPRILSNVYYTSETGIKYISKYSLLGSVFIKLPSNLMIKCP